MILPWYVCLLMHSCSGNPIFPQVYVFTIMCKCIFLYFLHSCVGHSLCDMWLFILVLAVFCGSIFETDLKWLEKFSFLPGLCVGNYVYVCLIVCVWDCVLTCQKFDWKVKKTFSPSLYQLYIFRTHAFLCIFPWISFPF